MPTLEDLKIVHQALTSCKTTDEITHNVQLPRDIVVECLDALRAMGVISKDSFSDTYCPLEEVAGNICEQCNRIIKDLGGENIDGNNMQNEET